MKTTKPKPPSRARALNANLGPRCLAPLTGTDTRALLAAVQVVELYSYCRGNQDVALAFGAVVRQMQDSTKELAYHSVAHVMEWSDRAELWALAELDPISVQRCAFEPGGRGRSIQEAA